MKRTKALMAVVMAVAICLSLFGFQFAQAEQEYQPIRVMTVTVDDAAPSPNPTFFIVSENDLFKEGGPFTVTGKIRFTKGDDIDGDPAHEGKIDFAAAAGQTKKSFTTTTGWEDITNGDGTPLTFAYNTGWHHFGLWYTKGALDVADVIIKNAAGDVIYDMAADQNFWADGTYKNNTEQKSIWYCYRYGKGDSVHKVVTNYYPKRSMTVTVDDAAPSPNPTFFIVSENDLFKVGGPFTVTGKIRFTKGDDIDGDPAHEGKIDFAAGAGQTKKSFTTTTGWEDITNGDGTPLTFAYNTGWHHFGLWYTKGALDVADVIIKNAAGDVIYDMAKDGSFWADGTYKNNTEQKSIWYCYRYGKGDSVHIVKSQTEVSETPSQPNTDVDEPTQVDDILIAHPAEVNRVLNITSTGAKASARLNLMYDDEMFDGKTGPFTVYTKVRLSGFEAVNEGGHAFAAFSYGEAAAKEQVALTANTEGFVWLKTSAGKYPTFATLTEDLNVHFGMDGAKGTLSVADLRILDQNGDIIYSMANDPTLYGATNAKPATGRWSNGLVGEGISGNVFSLTTKDSYVPNRVLTVTPTATVSAKDANPILAIKPWSELFAKGVTYTVTGKIKVNLTDPIAHGDDKPTAFASYDSFTKNYCNTNGWISIVNANGGPVTFKGGDDAHYMTFALWCSLGNLSLADIRVLDNNGKVVYDMNTDEEFWANQTSKTLGFTKVWAPATFGSGEDYYTAYTAQTATDHSAEKYGVPVFAEEGLKNDPGEGETSKTTEPPTTDQPTKPNQPTKPTESAKEPVSNTDTGAASTIPMTAALLLGAGAALVLLAGKKKH